MKILPRFTFGFCLFLSSFLCSVNTDAQIKAAFVSDKTTVNCPSLAINFTDSSKGSPTTWLWSFGDNTTSNLPSPSHLYQRSGRYTVSLIVQNSINLRDTALATITVLGPTVQISKTIDTSCSSINVKYTSKATGGDPIYYNWDYGDGKTSSSISSSTIHAFKAPGSYLVSLSVKDTNGCTVKIGDTLAFGSIAATLASTAKSLIANRECTDQFGWTNYYFDNNTSANLKDDILLLALRKNGNKIGTIGDGTFQLELAATQKAGTNEGVVINNSLAASQNSYYAMNRFWKVVPTTQPSTPVGVRYYFNTQDISDINGSYPTHDALLEQLLLYVTKGGNPDPTTNLAGASEVITMGNGPDASLTQWTYAYVGSGSHSAEFAVSSFTGGGGGVTGSLVTLPIKLITFNGKFENKVVKLIWSVPAESNSEKFDVEASTDGKNYIFIGQVPLATTTDYTFIDGKLTDEKVKFYRLVSLGKDGKKTYSEAIRIVFPTKTNAIAIYPVPANDFITVSFKTAINKTASVEVYNSLGLKVMQLTRTAFGNLFKLNTSALPAGRYKMIIFDNSDKIGDANFMILR